MQKVWLRLIKNSLLIIVLSNVSHSALAAYLESAIGNAVVYDATGAYYNPAALTLVEHPQLVGYISGTDLYSSFKGTTIQRATNFTQNGVASSRTYYFVPSAFFALPVNDRITLGLGEIYTLYGLTNYHTNSIVRYSGTYKYVSVLDLTPSFGLKLNDVISIGAGLDFEYFYEDQEFMLGSPPENIPDVKSVNKSSGWGYGVHAGFLVKPGPKTLVGLTYHSQVTVTPTGTSTFQANPPVISNNFSYSTIAEPPSTVFSIDHWLTTKLGLMGTVEYMQWSTITNINLNNVANKVGSTPTIIPVIQQPLHFQDTWRVMLCSHYAANKNWTWRTALSFDQDPNTQGFQTSISAGADAIILGLGASYKFNPALKLDMDYSHYFYENRTINHVNIPGTSNDQIGSLTEIRDILSARLTWNLKT